MNVTVPEGVVEIGRSAFCHSGVEDVSLPGEQTRLLMAAANSTAVFNTSFARRRLAPSNRKSRLRELRSGEELRGAKDEARGARSER